MKKVKMFAVAGVAVAVMHLLCPTVGVLGMALGMLASYLLYVWLCEE